MDPPVVGRTKLFLDRQLPAILRLYTACMQTVAVVCVQPTHVLLYLAWSSAPPFCRFKQASTSFQVSSSHICPSSCLSRIPNLVASAPMLQITDARLSLAVSALSQYQGGGDPATSGSQLGRASPDASTAHNNQTLCGGSGSPLFSFWRLYPVSVGSADVKTR